MKGYLTFAFIVGLHVISYSQTNTFPTSGSVGIGTTSPVYKLDVITSGWAGMRINTSSSTVGAPQLDLYDTNRNAETVISSTDNTLIGTYFASYSNHPLLFGTNAGSSPGAKMVILSNGNVGIGTTTPGYKLQISTPSSSGFSLHTNSSTVGGPQLDFYDDVRNTETVISSSDGIIDGTYIASYSNHPLLFGTNANASPSSKMAILSNGNVGIGTIAPDSKLTVAGKIHSQEINVTTSAGADFVFEEDYKLPALSEIEKFIKQNKHLPDIEPAKDMMKNGINVGEMNIKLLQKIEELMLYMIEMRKENDSQQKEINQLKSKL